MQTIITRTRKTVDVIERSEAGADRVLVSGLTPAEAGHFMDVILMSPCVTLGLVKWMTQGCGHHGVTKAG